MNVPSAFAERLRLSFGGRFRCRWSNRRQRFLIEQKVATGFEVPPTDGQGWPVPEDVRIRARDGYKLDFEVWPSGKGACPWCNADIRIGPLNAAIAPQCVRCKRIFVAVTMELDDAIIRYLRESDYVTGRGVDPVQASRDAFEERLRKERQEDANFSRESRAFMTDERRRLFDVPRTGYTGREQAWSDAPAPRFTKVTGVS